MPDITIKLTPNPDPSKPNRRIVPRGTPFPQVNTPGAAAQKRPTRRTGWGARALLGYLAGAVKGALMVVKYWIAAPIATGAVMKI